MGTHYFIALPIQPHLRQVLEQVSYSIDLDLFKHIVYPEDYHVTVAFLGDASEEQLSSLHDQLSDVVATFTPFELKPERIATFGREKQPRVLYASVEMNKWLDKLQQAVVYACSNSGFTLDQREYRPHITLAKKWRDSNKEIAPDWPTLICDSQEVSCLKLYRVAPMEKPRYQVVSTYAFNKL
ncbi:RNA 2',3'-cyclic phosphodiesterase [Pseudalkalibacillus hwajinpoensis]|uniref:RNA 2',3'-cyclic phosphodiesterase n=1 Tax=Guptibacillus hwajinpoensis TaxID=208199 RepID=A0A4U1MAI1_9BACL|nr:RNA 2',3'-cyclic phosphodiesterase [Pseudalkalibacillus hwajinpoensis]TKD67989.1 RNA 2',3'-cyclic phosphodiesterase [Pseudalkalibacillus hwajinpoensis]